MNLIIDLDEHQVITDFTNSNPVNPISIKSQDTPLFAVYFVQRGVNYDLGSGPGIRFGLFQAGNPNPLVACSSFVRALDYSQRVCYRGYPNFNTTALAGAIGTNTTLAFLGEFRYQTTGGTIARTADVTFNVTRVLLSETIIDNTTAAFITPAVGSTVSIAISSTTWLKSGLIVSIGAGAGNYTVTTITDATHFVAQNNGGTGNAAPGTSIPVGTTVGIAPATVISTYPDPSVIEVTTHKGAANGYAGLDANTLLLASRVPVDGATIVATAGGKIASGYILATVAVNFVTPVAESNVTITLSSTASLVVGQFVRIPIAGYYSVESITDGTHAVFENIGDPFNATSGVTITTGAVLLPAQATAGGGGGTPGQNAFTTTTASFTVPAASATVSVAMGSTAWLGGSGYVVFIQNAGYYAVSSVTDSTDAVLTNLGYAASNAAQGTTVPNGSQVSPGGIQGAASTATGANAYDTTAASFVMPAAAANVNITISNTGWLGVGQVVYIAGAGYFTVTSITSATVFNATNANYPGAAAPGATIASGAHVSPAGLIGPAGAGGAGLNAFTSVSASFTQPAASANVTVTVGTTAWMALGQIIYVSGGGYYVISSIGDLTHVTVTNLNYAGNATSGATVASGGTVSPAGLIGPAGSTPYTLTTSSFTMPAIGSSVTVTVGSTAFIGSGQNVYVAAAGHFTVATITDATHAVLTNNGATGNVSSGTVIASGASVTTAGAVGATGAAGPQGAQGNPGTMTNLGDAVSTATGTEVSLQTGASAGVGSIKKLKAGSNITLTDQGSSTGDVLIAASGGGGPSYWDPSSGLYFQDDFVFATPTPANDNRYTFTLGSGATVGGASTYGQNTTLKALGLLELVTGTAGSNTGASALWGGLFSPAYYAIVYGLGVALTFKTRVFIESSLPATGGGYAFRAGIVQGSGTLYFNPPVQGFYFEYSPDNNSGQWRVAVGGASPTYANTSVAVAFDTAYDLEIDVNAAWTSINFLINGTIAATVTTGIPTTSGAPLWQYAKGSAGTVSQKAAVDSWMIYYPVTR